MDFDASGSAGGKRCGADAGFDDDPNKCMYVFRTNIATLGLNPDDLMTGKVATLSAGDEQNLLTGSQVVQENQEARRMQSSDVAAGNSYNQALCDDCKRRRGDCVAPNVTTMSSDTAAAAERIYYDCLHACDSQCPQALVGSYGTAQNSSSQGTQTARGSGMIFWIVAEDKVTFKVHQGDEIADNIWMVDIGDLVETTKSLMFEVCRYKWCNGIGRCNANRPQDQTFCVENGKLYHTEEVTIGDKVYNIKVDEQDAGMAPYPNSYPKCAKLCRGSDGIHECDEQRIPTDPPICTYDQDNCDWPNIKPCHGCCSYQGHNYRSVILEDQNHYIIDAKPDACTNATKQCTVAAWSEEGGKFAVYSMENYDPNKLPLIPEDNQFLKAKWNNSYEVGLSTEYTEDYINEFTLIKGQSRNSRYNEDPNVDPTLFKLFPLLKLPDEIELNLVETCNICKKSMYANADVRANEAVITEVSQKMESCFRQVKQIESVLGSDDEDVKTLKSIYFYGYASKRGSHRPKKLPGAGGRGEYNVGCTTSGADANATETDEQDLRWGYCNKALSEDRNLYIMDKVLDNIGNDFKISVSKEKDYTNPTLLKGFTNTKGPVNRTRGRATFRLNKQPQGTGTEFAFISYPCGSDGAPTNTHYNSIESQAGDRYVLITPINEGKDYCATRMTCDNSEAEMTAIENSIKAKLRNKSITSLPLAVVTPPTGFVTVTEGDDSLIQDEEIAEFIREYTPEINDPHLPRA